MHHPIPMYLEAAWKASDVGYLIQYRQGLQTGDGSCFLNLQVQKSAAAPLAGGFGVLHLPLIGHVEPPAVVGASLRMRRYCE